MAKLLLLVAVMLAAIVAAEAVAVAPAPLPALTVKNQFSIKLILHNVASRNVTFKLVSPVVSNPVVCVAKTWNAIPPTLISSKQTTLKVSVRVVNNKHVAVKKNFTINLLNHFDAEELKGKTFVVLTAVESWSWKTKYLLITIGEVVVLSFKL